MGQWPGRFPVEREAPTLPATVDNRRQEQGTQRRGVNSQRSSRAGLSRPAGDRQAVATTREPGCRLQSGVPSCGGRPPRLAPQWRTHTHARVKHTHPPSAAPQESPPTRPRPASRRTPPAPARTRPSGRRRVRTQQHAEHIEGHVRQPRLVKHGLPLGCGRHTELRAGGRDAVF
jgi:hypothetical protein